MTITWEQALEIGKKRLQETAVPNFEMDAWYLFSAVFSVNRAQYMLRQNELVTEEAYNHYIDFLKKREKRIPLQYILGEQEFMGLSFYVNQHVLIPRQDTETLAEELLKVVNGKSVLDLCCGSGCIIISLAKLSTLKKAVGADFSGQALTVGIKNAKRNDVFVEWFQSDLFDQVDGKYDIIVSNPPYIRTEVIDGLMPEVRDYEPRIALDGKEDGLYFYRRIIEEAPAYLHKNGRLYFEIGFDQQEDVRALMEEKGYQQITCVKDLVGEDRVMFGTWKGDYNV